MELNELRKLLELADKESVFYDAKLAIDKLVNTVECLKLALDTIAYAPGETEDTIQFMRDTALVALMEEKSM